VACHNWQLLDEFHAIIPEEAKNMQLRVQWHCLRDKVLTYARQRVSQKELADLLSCINDEYEEGLSKKYNSLLQVFSLS
jgi:hypothetical protein